jgi:hypothetical protein
VLALEPGTLAQREKIDVILRDDAMFAAAAVIPPKLKGSVGKPRIWPDYVWALWPALRGVFGSHTAVERELRRGSRWEYIRRELRRLRPDLPALPAKVPRRQDYEYFRDTYLTTDEGIARALELHTELATAQAKEAGNLDPNGGGSFTHPSLERSPYGDGKVVDGLYKTKEGQMRKSRRTGKQQPARFDPDVTKHKEGGGNTAEGIKFAFLNTRRDEGRFILGVEHVTKGKDEAKAAIEMLRRLKPHAPGAQAVVWDMILRGEHIQTILTEIGIVPVVGVHAKENPEGHAGRKAGTYVPKTADLDDLEVTIPDGSTKTVHIAACDGRASIKEVKENGQPHYEGLTASRLQRHEDKKGYRWYGYYRLPEEYGGKEFSLRHHGDDDDPVNWTENLRPIPPGTKDYNRLMKLRPDSESVNRGIEDSLYINRASGKGWRRVMVDLLGYARLVNAITLARCRAREPAPAAA